jgi:putative ABC transport system permease protein
MSSRLLLRDLLRLATVGLRTVPAAAVAGGLLAACLLGALAGLYPAMRASRLTPTEALRTT